MYLGGGTPPTHCTLRGRRAAAGGRVAERAGGRVAGGIKAGRLAACGQLDGLAAGWTAGGGRAP